MSAKPSLNSRTRGFAIIEICFVAIAVAAIAVAVITFTVQTSRRTLAPKVTATPAYVAKPTGTPRSKGDISCGARTVEGSLIVTYFAEQADRVKQIIAAEGGTIEKELVGVHVYTITVPVGRETSIMKKLQAYDEIKLVNCSHTYSVD